MDDGLSDAILDLKQAIEKQIEVQQETNELIKHLMRTLSENAQTMDDLRVSIEAKKS